MNTNFKLRKGSPWSREELLIAFSLYCNLPFGKYHSRNPEIIDTAGKIGRSPGAVAMKLVNLASLDPTHQARGITGLKNVSTADRKIWEEFAAAPTVMMRECEEAASVLGIYKQSDPSNDHNDVGTAINRRLTVNEPTERRTSTNVRIGQGFFRRIVLSSYGSKCCVCNLQSSKMLVASHIVPWHANENTRLDPRNGLSLCVLHDRAFDVGMLTLSTSLTVEISQELLAITENSHSYYFQKFIGSRINLPDKFTPKEEYISWHRENIWLG